MAELTDQSPPADELDTARAAMWDMITGYRNSQVVRVAAALGLAEHCADRPVTAEEIARLEWTDVTATARFLRMCAAVGLVSAVDEERFTGTPLLNALHKDTAGSLRGFALSLPGWGHWLPWGQLWEAVQTGRRQTAATLGQDLFDYYATEPGEAAAFTEGLVCMKSIVGPEAASVINTCGVEMAVDVGGATGDLLYDLMKVNPLLNGIVFDVPHVSSAALAAAARNGCGDRVRVVTGDFFEAVPEGGDLYLLRNILHDWDDEKCVRILANCRQAMRPGARVVVLEMILGEIGQEPVLAPSEDINMLVMLGGRERTGVQFDALFAAAGLRRTAVTPTQSSTGVIEAVAA
ncbi:MAG: methyltransferase [Trebonia sp.]